MMNVKTTKEGFCAVCGAEITDDMYNGDITIEDDYLYHSFKCKSCGSFGEVCYHIVATEYHCTYGEKADN